MDPIIQIIAMAGIEGVKFLASYYVEQKRLQGMTDAQIVEEAKREYAIFKASNPDDIPDPTQEAKRE